MVLDDSYGKKPTEKFQMNIASNFLNLRDRVTIDIAISPQLDGYSYTVIPAGLIVYLGPEKVEQKHK